MTELEQLKEILKGEEKWGWYSDLMDEGFEADGFETISTEYVDKGRWASTVKCITKTPSGKFYRWYYSEGATENQENEYDDRQEPVEVKPVEVTTIKYVPITRSE